MIDAVAMDGPAGAGKSTVAKAVANALGFRYIDTGSMYRAVTVAASRRGVKLEDPAAMGEVAKAVTLTFNEDGTRIYLDGEDVSAAIRTPELTRLVKFAAGAAPVREILVARQQILAAERPCVMEGRDITTVVLPQAKWRLYLDASVRCRAERRLRDFAAAGKAGTLEECMADVEARDRSDRERAVGPLKRIPEQLYLDTTGMPADEVVAWIVAQVRK